MRICGGTRGPLRVAAYPSPGFREQRDFEFARIGPSDHSGTQYACSGHSGKKRKDVRGRSQSPPAFNPSAIPESVALTLSGHCRPVARFLCASATMLRVRSALWLALPVISRTSHLVSTEGYFEHPFRLCKSQPVHDYAFGQLQPPNHLAHSRLPKMRMPATWHRPQRARPRSAPVPDAV